MSSGSMSMSLIDPYGLLGATVDSTRAEVKQAYYALSLLVHPDKGGSAADMIVVHNAYRYVIAQLSEINRTVTLEDLEQRFALFCMQQLAEPPPFAQINVDMRLFHETFDSLPRGDSPGQALCASMASGYADSMEQSEYRTDNPSLTYVPLDFGKGRGRDSRRGADDGGTEGVPFDTQVITYVEPETSSTDTALYFSEMDHTDGLEDYGTACPFHMTDYRAAFNTNYEVLPDVCDKMLNRTFDDLVQARRDQALF